MRFLSLILVLMIAACGEGPVYKSVVYGLPATPGGRMCVQQCAKARDYCGQSCDYDNRACYNNVQAAAQEAYDRYARERFGSQMTAAMLPSDFEHPEACVAAKKSCMGECDKPYDSCYRSCGGTVAVTTSCQFLCFE